jgi:hypothetical protein
MTRTERAAFPRALQKDRHDTRTGLNSDPKHIQKGGAGAHGWGSLDDEARLEAEAYEDEPGAGLDAAVREPTPGSPRQELDPADVEKAREFRKHALKDGPSRVRRCGGGG